LAKAAFGGVLALFRPLAAGFGIDSGLIGFCRLPDRRGTIRSYFRSGFLLICPVAPMHRYDWYFRFSLIWLAALMGACAYLLIKLGVS
jgi:hypothetical protein